MALKPAHVAAHAALAEALGALRARGVRTPCAGRWAAFVSDDREARAAAAESCGWCPVIGPCAEVGRHETAGVWAGKDRDRNPGRPHHPEQPTNQREAQP